MFQKFFNTTFPRCFFFALVLLAFAFTETARAMPTQPCAVDAYLAADAHWQDVLDLAGAAHRLAVSVPSAGVLVAEVAVPDGPDGGPLVAADWRACAGLTVDTATVDQTANHVLLAIPEPGVVALQVSHADPRRALGAYQVFTRFLPLTMAHERSMLPADTMGGFKQTLSRSWWMDDRGRVIVERVTLDSGSLGTKTEMEVIDPNPAGLLAGPSETTFSSRMDAAWLHPEFQSEKTEMEVIDPNPAGLLAANGRGFASAGYGSSGPLGKTEMEVIDPNPAGLRAGVSHGLRAWVTVSSTGRSLLGSKTEMEVIDPNPAGLRPLPTLDRWSFSLEIPGWYRSTAPWSTVGAADEDLVRFLLMSAGGRIASHGAARPSMARRLDLCETRRGDDHQDAMACATPVAFGVAQTGTLSADWQEDADSFAFTVGAVSTVEVRAFSDSTLRGSLYSESRRQIGPRALEGRDLRMIERLEPGTYVFRVEAREARPASYEVTVHTIDG